MPSPTIVAGRRISINEWRAKIGKRDVFSHDRKSAVEEFIRKYPGPGKPRLVAPNRMGHRGHKL